MKARVFLASVAVAGSAIGVGQLTAKPSSSSFELALSSESEELVGAVYDVRPCITGSCQTHGILGTYPNGTVGLAVSTTGQNVGSVKLPWYQSPDVHHPVIGMNMFRLTPDGRLEQIGLSWLKHAWFAVQGNSCGQCTPHSNGQQLGIGCADTYGSGLNADQYWLGPRWEVSPNENMWMNGTSWTGSHFARNSGGGDSSSHSNGVMHRLRVRTDDLNDSGSGVRYYYEAIYWLLTKKNDSNWNALYETPDDMFNNSRHQEVRPVWNAQFNRYDFTHLGSTVNGPVLAQWGDEFDRAAPTDDGVAYVSSRAVDLGNGLHRYEYAVMNLSITRQIGEVVIPVGGASVSDIGFHAPRDGYWDANNNYVHEGVSHDGVYQFDYADWTSTVDGGNLRFAPPAAGSGVTPNTLRYGTTYTYWFTSDVAPANAPGEVSLTPYAEGGIGAYTAAAIVPAIPADEADLTAVQVTVGNLLSGGLPEILASDDTSLRASSGFGSTFLDLHNMTMVVDAQTTVATPSTLSVSIESRIDEPAGTGRLRLWNWNTGQFVQVGQFSIGNTDGVDTVVNIPAANYVNGAGEIRAQFQSVVFVPIFAFVFDTFVDHVEILVND